MATSRADGLFETTPETAEGAKVIATVTESESPSPPSHFKKGDDHGHVATWKKDEVQEIPKNNLLVGKSWRHLIDVLVPGFNTKILEYLGCVSFHWIIHGHFLGCFG